MQNENNITNHSRIEIQLTTFKEINDFVCLLNSDGSSDKYVIEDINNEFRVNARSVMGVIGMFGEYDHCYLVNASRDGIYPHGIDEFRK